MAQHGLVASVSTNGAPKPGVVKQCCAGVYESNVARYLLGDSYHPGGLKLTERLGHALEFSSATRVLDIASGSGASAIFLAERFGCAVVGIDYSRKNVEEANARAAKRDLQSLVRFQEADAENLPFAEASFDAVICECALCLFPDKATAVREIARVLRIGGRLGLSDVTRNTDLPEELHDLLAWAACIADAQPAQGYRDLLSRAGLLVTLAESHDEAIMESIDRIRARLLGAEILIGLGKLSLPALDMRTAKALVRHSVAAVESGSLGYVVITAVNSRRATTGRPRRAVLAMRGQRQHSPHHMRSAWLHHDLLYSRPDSTLLPPAADPTESLPKPTMTANTGP